jgi:DNA-binding response OmpR family regulator
MTLPEPSPTLRRSVLIVEDDRELRQFYQTLFESDGFRSEQAHNGLQAFEKAIESRPDLILTDIAVPGIDGIELCRRLRADDRTRLIPVIAVTGYADRRYPDRAIEAGADHVIIKPCRGSELLAEAHRLIDRSADLAG